MEDVKVKPSDKSGPDLMMVANRLHDPGLQDLFGTVQQELEQYQADKMTNLSLIPNDGHVVSKYPHDHPAAKTLFQIESYFKLGDKKRNYALIVEDMQKSYHEWVDFVQPESLKLLQTFRKLKLPVVWSSWSRRPDDGNWGALDRFYGPQGVVGEHGELNPCYIYGEDGADCIESLAPINDDEWSCYIKSFHLSKFADLDAEGREFLYPLLQAWGVNTVVVVGAWTDDCIAATLFEGMDRYGYDMVMVSDAMATATTKGSKMVECLKGACCVSHTADEVVEVLSNYPELIDPPHAPLHGSSRFLAPKQKR